MIAWGDALVKELAARRCLVFFGAGASASCQATVGNSRLPNWERLLQLLLDRLANGHANRAIAAEFIAKKQFLDAAEVLVASLVPADYHAVLRGIFEQPRFRQSRIHEAVLRIDPKVVVTTNFDTIYDNFCRTGAAAEGYNVIKHYDSHLVAQLRSPIRCIVKAHGCITDPAQIVLNRSQYFEARQKHSHFFHTLNALFLTHTVLFVGYSLSDPDIQLTLENAHLSAPSTHRHYFVAEAGTHEAVKAAVEKTYNVHFLEFPTGDYADLEASLDDLAGRVEEFRAVHPDV